MHAQKNASVPFGSQADYFVQFTPTAASGGKPAVRRWSEWRRTQLNRGMTAFTDSGRSNHRIFTRMTGCFRPEADIDGSHCSDLLDGTAPLFTIRDPVTEIAQKRAQPTTMSRNN